MAECEAFIMGLQFLKDLGAKKINIHGDSELIIQWVKGVYQTKNPRMRSYRNLALDLLQNFTECNFTVIPRLQNAVADALAVLGATFKIPIHKNRRFEIEVKHRLAVPDNIKYWQVFDDDKHIERFLEGTNEFTNTSIDTQCCFLQEILYPLDKTALEISPMQTPNISPEKGILQLKNNNIPRGLIPFERLFNQNDVALKPDPFQDTKLEDFNMGSPQQQKIVKLSRSLSIEERA